jgi:hypothetical protein
MAQYKYSSYLKQNQDAAFDADHKPGGMTPHSGVYRCMGCGREVVSEESRPLPPQNHHQHTPSQGGIRWRMVVYADHEPKA